MNKKQLLGLVLAIMVLLTAYFMPVPIGLSHIGLITIALMIFFLIFLIAEVLPVGVSCFLCLALFPVLGVTKNLSDGLDGFASTILFFILASFGLAAAVNSTPIINRILYGLLIKIGKNVKRCILTIMVAGALVSSVVTDLPTVIVFMGIGAKFLKLFINETDRKITAKSLMMGIPISVMLGGLITPVGAGVNILTIGLIQKLAGVQVSFLQWMICSIPIVVIMVPLAWIILIKVYPPAEIEPDEINIFLDTIAVKEKLSKQEWKVIFIITIMLFFWLMSSFYPNIEVAVVSLIGCVLFFLPGINILTWKQYEKSVSWTSFLLIGTVLCLANSIIENGVSEWFAVYVLPSSLSLTPMVGVFFVAALIFVIMLIVPVAPALIGVLAPVIASLAVTMGMNPAILIVTLGFCVCNCYLFPIDAIPMMTYTAGYYKMTEMPKATIWLQLAFIILATVWLPIAGCITGLL